MIANPRKDRAKTLVIMGTVVGAIAAVLGAFYTAKAYWLAEAQQQQQLAQTPLPPRPPSTDATPAAPTGGTIINGPVQTTHGPNSPVINGNGNTVWPSK
jgi:hypothetical protein